MEDKPPVDPMGPETPSDSSPSSPPPVPTGASPPTGSESSAATPAPSPAAPPPPAQPAAPPAASPPATVPAAAVPQAPPVGAPGETPNPGGMLARTAELDRRIGTRTYAGAALLLLTLATAIVAIVLAVDARDNSASNEDLNRISAQISTSAGIAPTAEVDTTAFETRIASLEGQLQELRDQISALESAGNGSSTGEAIP